MKPTANLLTADESREAFCRSAVSVLSDLGDRPLAHSLQSHLLGSHLPAEQLAGVFADHMIVIEAIVASGHRWVIEEEIIGIESCAAQCGFVGAAAIVASQLDPWKDAAAASAA